MIRLGICNELFEGWDFAETCQAVKRLGYDGLEIAPFTLAPRITDLNASRRQELKRIVEDAGLATIGLHWLLAKTEGFYLTTPDEAIRRRTGDYLVALAEATRDLGGSLMVLGSPKQRDLMPGVTLDQASDYAVEVFDRIMPAVGSFGVDLCLEPLAPAETNFLNTCDQAEALIARVGHPNLKLHMDVKAQSGEVGRTVPELIAHHAERAGHFHAQDTNLKGPGMGSVDFGPILKSLVASGYDRWVSVEVFDFTPGAEETARQSIACLKRELAAAGGLVTTIVRKGLIRALFLLVGVVPVALAMDWSASRPKLATMLNERSSFALGAMPGGDYHRHSWVIHNDGPTRLKLRTRFTSGRCGFSLWLGEDYFVPANGLLTVSLTIPTPSRSAAPFAEFAEVLTNDPETPRLRFRIFGITGPSPIP